MNRPISISKPQNKAAMPPRISEIVLDYFTFRYYLSYLRTAYHPVGPEHLPQRMGQEKDF